MDRPVGDQGRITTEQKAPIAAGEGEVMGRNTRLHEVRDGSHDRPMVSQEGGSATMLLCHQESLRTAKAVGHG